MITRSSPANHEAEQAILCCAFLAPRQTMDACGDASVTTDSFHGPGNAVLFDILAEFYRDNEPIDVITITEVLHSRGRLNDCAGRVEDTSLTGAAYLTGINGLLPSAGNISRYVEIVKSKAFRRHSISELTKALESAYDESITDAAIAAAAQEALLRVMKSQEGKKVHNRTMRELVLRSTARIQAALDGDGRIEMPYGLFPLDFETGGLRAPETTVLSGKSSDGKTAFGLNVAEHLAVERKKKVGIISLEMSDDQLADRLLASIARVNIREIKRSRAITDQQRDDIAAAAKKLADAPIFIRDDGQLSISEIGATFASWKSQHGLDVGIIDHAQLARGDGRTTGRTEEVEQISRALKPMAKRLGIALIVLSQVSEGSDGAYRTKNSMALTEDADNLFTISHRAAEGGGMNSWINISKQRDGERNKSIPVTFLQHIGRFEAREKEPEPELIHMPPPKKNRKG